jgi:hypothetical protein
LVEHNLTGVRDLEEAEVLQEAVHRQTHMVRVQEREGIVVIQVLLTVVLRMDTLQIAMLQAVVQVRE